MQIIQATLKDIGSLAPLFDQYRQFYGQKSDIEAAKKFLMQRIGSNESVIFLAIDNGKNKALGFVQLYPCFTSVDLGKIWVLNDLFVSPDARRQGVARMLIGHSIIFSKKSGACRIELETRYDNKVAQELYEELGFYKQTGSIHYSYSG